MYLFFVYSGKLLEIRCSEAPDNLVLSGSRFLLLLYYCFSIINVGVGFQYIR